MANDVLFWLWTAIIYLRHEPGPQKLVAAVLRTLMETERPK